ncbi:LysR substrate-binding domain-containing protein [Marinobacterium arenosum]|uniref:LysR substrate-binding domain-containing protein n=1 Tax=Marinobacterium arenosum TaxID=2862496 RepID=UPI001C942EED|nr:LysR substrate-binding domain-containing protein [Marinobacterium arenosum]MBY4675790.1 LysR family transcriptional regulator [Marinobacterium arenosum]
MNTRLPPLNALRVFRSAAELGSFKAAAEQLHVTQAAISQQIRTLEEHLGEPLFVRLNREIRLTCSGEQLLPYVQRGFEAFEAGVNSLQSDPEPNQLTVSTLPSFASRWLVPKLGRFNELAPELSVRVMPGNTLERFATPEVDLAIRFGQGNYSGLHSERLMDDYLVPLCSPHLLDGSQEVNEQLSALPLLIDDSEDLEPILRSFDGRLPGLSGQRSRRLLVSDATLLTEAVLSGQGLALLRFSLVYGLIERGLLICPLAGYLPTPFSYYLVAPPSYMKRPKVQQFRRWLQAECRQVEKAWQAFHAENLQNTEPLKFV